jgi:hypothetical protein
MIGSLFKVVWILLKGLFVLLSAELLTLLTTLLIAPTLPPPILDTLLLCTLGTYLTGIGLLLFRHNFRQARWPLLVGLTIAALTTLLSLLPYQPALLLLLLPLTLLPAYRLYHKRRQTKQPHPRPPPPPYPDFLNDPTTTNEQCGVLQPTAIPLDEDTTLATPKLPIKQPNPKEPN